MPRITVDMNVLWKRVNELFKTVHALEVGLQDIEVVAVEVAFARRLLKVYDGTGTSKREDVMRLVAELDKLLDADERAVNAKLREGSN